MSSNNRSDEEPSTPPEMRDEEREISKDLLPKQSKQMYEETYRKFVDWKTASKAITFENCLKVYFKKLMESYKPSTIWSIYSKIKSTIQIYENISIDSYKELTALLSQNSRGYKGKKSQVFTSDQINLFLENALDEIYLVYKIVMIFGISGCCRKGEIYLIKIHHVKKQGDLFEVDIPYTKNKVPRKFIIDKKFAPFIEKYQALRPPSVQRDNFFLQYHNGKCSTQVIGINTLGSMPKKIAQFLKLENPENYTGHSFRRTSATVYADAGASTLDLQRHRGWKSATVAQSYVDDSIKHKEATAKKITKAILGSKKENSPESQNASTKKLKLANFPTDDKRSSPEKTFVLNNCNVTINYNK